MKALATLTLVIFGPLLLVKGQNGRSIEAKQENIDLQLTEERDLVFELYNVQKPPVFPGGEAALLKFIGSNMQVRPVSKNETPPTKVIIDFIVEKDGTVDSVKFLYKNTLYNDLLKFTEKMPRWAPGEQNGKPVRVIFRLPIRCIKWE